MKNYQNPVTESITLQLKHGVCEDFGVVSPHHQEEAVAPKRLSFVYV